MRLVALLAAITLAPVLLVAPASAADKAKAKAKAADKAKAEEPANPHALGEWDTGARHPDHFRELHREEPYDPAAWRITLGVLGGGTVFDYGLDLGGGNYDMGLAPAGASSWGGRLGLDIGRWVTFSVHGTYTPTTFFEGGSRADIVTACAELVGRVRGWPHDRMEAFVGGGGGVMMLTNNPDYMAADTDGMARIVGGLRWVGDWLIPQLEAAALIADGLAVGSKSVSWQFVVSMSAPVLSW